MAGTTIDIAGSALKGAGNLMSGFAGALGRFLTSFETLSENFDTASVNMARKVGMSQAAFEALSKNMLDMATAVDESNLTFIQKYGKSATDMVNYANQIQGSVGRTLSLTTTQLGRYAALETVLGDSGVQIAQTFMNFGMDITSTEQLMSQMRKDAVEDGVRLDKVTANMQANMSKVMSYTFENGVRGFTSMAERAAEVNINMQSALQFADKIKDISSAIEVGANLQVLGGQFASLSNPLEMFYEATSDVGALQERMINMFKGMGTYNRETNQVTLSRFNRMRVQAAAQQMGVSADEMFKMINTSAMKDEILRQMSGVNGITEQQRNYIGNIASINDRGQAVVNYQGQETEVSKLTANQIRELQMLNNSGMTAQSINQMAIDVHTIAQNKSIENSAAEAEAGKDFYRNPEEVVKGLGSYMKNVTGVIGSIFNDSSFGDNLMKGLESLEGTLTDKAGNFVGNANEKIGSWIANATSQIGSRLANNSNLTADERAKAISLQSQLQQMSNTLARGGSVRQLTEQFRVGFAGNQIIGKGNEIGNIIANTLGKYSDGNGAVRTHEVGNTEGTTSSSKPQAIGGPINVPVPAIASAPHANGGWIATGLLEGGLLQGGKPGVETPISRQYTTGGIFENTAQLNEYVINTASTKNSFDAVKTINDNPQVSFKAIPESVLPHDNGGVISVPHENGGFTGNIGGNISLGDSTITLKFDGEGKYDTTTFTEAQKREIVDMVERMLYKSKGPEWKAE